MLQMRMERSNLSIVHLLPDRSLRFFKYPELLSKVQSVPKTKVFSSRMPQRCIPRKKILATSDTTVLLNKIITSVSSISYRHSTSPKKLNNVSKFTAKENKKSFSVA